MSPFSFDQFRDIDFVALTSLTQIYSDFIRDTFLSLPSVSQHTHANAVIEGGHFDETLTHSHRRNWWRLEKS